MAAIAMERVEMGCYRRLYSKNSKRLTPPSNNATTMGQAKVISQDIFIKSLQMNASNTRSGLINV